jgi:hypothetical protein
VRNFPASGRLSLDLICYNTPSITIEQDHFLPIWEARHKIIARREYEYMHPCDPWRVYDSDTNSYNEPFGTLTDGDFFGYVKKLIKHKKKIKPTFFGCEIMGTGALFRDFERGSITASLGVTLADVRPVFTKLALDPYYHHDLLKGDILSTHTFPKIQKWLYEHDADGFDLIVYRPLAGKKLIPRISGLQYYLLNHMYQLLTQQTGELFVEANPGDQDILRVWRRICKQNGFHVKMNLPEAHTPSFKIIRTPTSPPSLPTL